jgi:hypothetical protein
MFNFRSKLAIYTHNDIEVALIRDFQLCLQQLHLKKMVANYKSLLGQIPIQDNLIQVAELFSLFR